MDNKNNKELLVDIKELKTIINWVLDDIIERGYDRIDIPYDLYWLISASDQYNPNARISIDNLMVGSAFDEWESLQEMYADNAAVPYCLVWISSLLRYIGELPPKDTSERK